MKLYSYWRSTTSIRVRAVLNLKGFAYDIVPVDLVAGAQRQPEFVAMNPGQGVPVLVLEDGSTLTQSLAIIDYLDAQVADPPMLPADPLARNRVLAAALTIAADIHPVNNLRISQYLTGQFGCTPDQVGDWMRHWMQTGLTAFQAMVDPDTALSFGDTPDMADICLVAQMYNARRWDLDLAPFGRLVEIDNRARAIEAIHRAMPEQQPDAT